VRIRAMTSEDLTDVARLSGELGYPLDSLQARRRFEALARDDHGLFVAEEGGRVVGWIHVSATPTLVDEAKTVIDALIVDESVRSRGIGRLLVARGEAWAAERGHRTLRVRTRITRDRAHQFYRKCGFELDKTQHIFDKNLG
jgi:GNAT superfamily N-acetyltransferase